MNNRLTKYAASLLLGMGLMVSHANAAGLKDKLENIQISGFVDTSYSDDNKTGSVGGVTLDQVELDIEYSEGNVGLRFDLESSGDGFGTTPFEQAFITYTFEGVGDEGTTFTFGKFNAPIGWELLDAPDMYQYSHALVFDNGLPTNLTGAMLSTAFGMIDGTVYVANGTDTNAKNTQGSMKTFGGRLGISPIEGVNIGVSLLIGDNNAGTFQTQKFNTLDIDLTYEGIENLIIGAEYNRSKNWTAVGSKSVGYFIVGHYDFTDMFGATLRYGSFDSDTAVNGKKTAVTGALTTALGGGLGALVEYRAEKDTAAGAADVNSYAFEMTYAF